MRRRKDLASCRDGNQPPGEQDRADRQCDPGEAVQDRHQGGELEPIPDREHEWRERTFHPGHPFLWTQKQRNRCMTSWSYAGGGELRPVTQSNKSVSSQSSRASNRPNCTVLNRPPALSANEPKIRSISCVPRCQQRNSRRLRRSSSSRFSESKVVSRSLMSAGLLRGRSAAGTTARLRSPR